MAQFHALPYESLLALVNSGGAVPGDLYYASDRKELFLAITGQPNPSVFPLSSLILTGEYSLSGPQGPAGATGATGPQGPAGPAAPLSQMVALAVALG
jgi:hypothetical protein